jgi:hypothetical protein
MLDPRFDCYTRSSRRLYEFDDAGELHLLTAEIRRMLDGLAADAPARIAKGTMSREQGEAVIFLWLAICEDLAAQSVKSVERQMDGTIAERLAELRRKNNVAWSDKITAMRGEIETRRAGYPTLVNTGRLTSEAAQRQLERIEAVHDLYWRQGYAFDGSKDELRAMTDGILDTYLDQQQEQAA